MNEALAIVCAAPVEDWGDGWLVMHKCLATFDPTKGTLRYYFARAWRYARLDTERLRVRRINMVHLAPGMDVEYKTPMKPDPFDLSRLKPERRELFDLLARGNTYEAIAASTGTRLGTVKSRIHNARTAMMRSA